MSLLDDPIVQEMLRVGIPLSRDNYIAAIWGNTPPEPWTGEDEDDIPEELQDWSWVPRE